MDQPTVYIGTAGWSLPSQVKGKFPARGSHLQRYSQVFNCVEINSSFYRDHKDETYIRWGETVPDHFRFSVKLSNYFTIETGLQETGERLYRTLQGISGLGKKWGCLLVQLPASLYFLHRTTARFLEDLRAEYEGPIVWEPRNLTWATPEVWELLNQFNVQKVYADPILCPVEGEEESSPYHRLHGSPRMYRSNYETASLNIFADQLMTSSQKNPETWCIFDNTTYGYATENALEFKKFLNEKAAQQNEQKQHQLICTSHKIQGDYCRIFCSSDFSLASKTNHSGGRCSTTYSQACLTMT
jgi:uncharacterized protein YecE (DUF72 family)